MYKFPGLPLPNLSLFRQKVIKSILHTVLTKNHVERENDIRLKCSQYFNRWTQCAPIISNTVVVFKTHIFGQRTSLFGSVEDLIVEDGKVESQPQTDGVCGLHLLLTDVKCILVGTLRVGYRFCVGTQNMLQVIAHKIRKQKCRNC